MTNAEKFREVFGFYPDRDMCVQNTPCSDCEYNGEFGCAHHFWNDEYKEVNND